MRYLLLVSAVYGYGCMCVAVYRVARMRHKLAPCTWKASAQITWLNWWRA